MADTVAQPQLIPPEDRVPPVGPPLVAPAAPESDFPKAVGGVLVDMEADEIEARVAEEGAWTAALTDRLKAQVKDEASRRILSILPDWKQRNLTARAAELAKILNDRAWSADEAAEWAAGQIAWDSIKAVRAASNAIEAGLDEMSAEDAAAFVPGSAPEWP